MNTRSTRQAAALFVMILLAVLPATINQFHNHDDHHVHHDCPVYQWEITFAATGTVVLGLIVAAYVLSFIAPGMQRYTPAVLPTGFNRRAPPGSIPE